jgi:hypothetical protein
MGRNKLSCLLVLLVVSTPLDDLWAAATPGPEDDVLAAANNDFLLAARPSQRRGPFDRGVWAPTVYPNAANLPSTASPLRPPPKANPGGPWGAARLYALMSLQR